MRVYKEGSPWKVVSGGRGEVLINFSIYDSNFTIWIYNWSLQWKFCSHYSLARREPQRHLPRKSRSPMPFATLRAGFIWCMNEWAEHLYWMVAARLHFVSHGLLIADSSEFNKRESYAIIKHMHIFGTMIESFILHEIWFYGLYVLMRINHSLSLGGSSTFLMI